MPLVNSARAEGYSFANPAAPQSSVNLLSLSECFLNASKLKSQGKLEDAINQYKAALNANPEYMVCRTADQCYSSLQHAHALSFDIPRSRTGGCHSLAPFVL